ncbi:uncharacterized protein LOC129738228 [Uranotaenia lowii]|uniref:uncharacterized protein LOC129738228 n=1 Tax=Uranotaenia lowii TaxID=190385 RepID=UPI002478C2B7|nr:uncharacterized protein LOC129738228 [Uranotaenia lowii]
MLYVTVLVVSGLLASALSKQCPNSDDVCVPVRYCPPIDSAIRKLLIKPNRTLANQIYKRACHSVDEEEPRVCCNIADLPVDKTCQTRAGYDGQGRCVAPEKCPTIADGLISLRQSANLRAEMERALCYRNETHSYYCCPEKVLANKVKPRDRPTSKVSKRSFRAVENEFRSCRDPAGKSGVCVPARQCYRIYKMISSGAVYKNKQIEVFVKKSRCTSDSTNGHSVCCAQFDSGDNGASTNLIRHPAAKKLGLAACGRYRLKDKILGGREAGLGHYPWMANLLYLRSSKLKPLCAGSLIHPKYVLTAAHCLKGSDGPHRVRLGEYNLNSNPDCDNEGRCLKPYKEYKIAKQIPHENFNKKTADYDIGLVLLEGSADISMEQIYPICLPLTEDLQTLKPKKLTVTGWGFTEHSATSSVLLEANLRNVDRTYLCQGESTFCSRGWDGESHCPGDSGGPYQAPVPVDDHLRYVVFGVISGGSGTCTKNDTRPASGVLVGYHLSWILDNMTANNQRNCTRSICPGSRRKPATGWCPFRKPGDCATASCPRSCAPGAPKSAKTPARAIPAVHCRSFRGIRSAGTTSSASPRSEAFVALRGNRASTPGSRTISGGSNPSFGGGKNKSNYKLKTEDGSVFTIFLPPNTTAAIQPIDQIIIRMIKSRERWNGIAAKLAKTEEIDEEDAEYATLNDDEIVSSILHPNHPDEDNNVEGSQSIIDDTLPVHRPTTCAYMPQYTKKTFKHGGGNTIVLGCFSRFGFGPLYWVDKIMD